MARKELVRLKKRIECEYGQWFLVNLTSGRWSAIWYASIESEELFIAIVNEDKNWFDGQIVYAQVPSYSTKEGALKFIIAMIEKNTLEDPANLVEYNKPHLKRARRHFLRETEKIINT